MPSQETIKTALEQEPKRPLLEVAQIRENPEKAALDLDFYGQIEQYAIDKNIKQKEGWGDALTSATGEAKELITTTKENKAEENYIKADVVIEEAQSIAKEILKTIDDKASGKIEIVEEIPIEESELDEISENTTQNLRALLELIKETQKNISAEDAEKLKGLNNEIAELEKKALEALVKNNTQQANEIIAEIDDKAQKLEAEISIIKNETKGSSTKDALAEAATATEKATQKHSDNESSGVTPEEFQPSKDSLKGPHFTLEATLADLSQQTTEKIKMLKRKLDAISTEKTENLLTEIENTENKLSNLISDIETRADNEHEDDMTDEELNSLVPFVKKINQLAEDIKYYENSDEPLPDTEHPQEESPEIKNTEEENEEDITPQQDEPMKKRGGKFDDEENLPIEDKVKKIKDEEKIMENEINSNIEVPAPTEQITSSEKEQLKDEIRKKVETLSKEARSNILSEEELEKEMVSADIAGLKNILNSVEKMPDSIANAKESRKEKLNEEKVSVAPPKVKEEIIDEAPSSVEKKDEEIILEEPSTLPSSKPLTPEISSEIKNETDLRAEILMLKKEMPKESSELKQLLPDLEERLKTMPLEDLTRTRNSLISLKRDALKKETEIAQEKPEKTVVEKEEVSTEPNREATEPIKSSPFDVLDLENPKEARENLKRILKEIQNNVRNASKNNHEKEMLESASEKLRKKIVDVRTSIYELEYMPQEDIRRPKAEKTAEQRIEKTKELYHELIEIMGPIAEIPKSTEQTPNTEILTKKTGMPKSEITSERKESRGIKIGNRVQWESQGALQFEKPQEVRGFSDDGTWVFIKGSQTGIPIEEIKLIAEKENVVSSQPNEEQLLNKQGEAMTHLIEKLEQQGQDSSKNEIAPELQTKNTQYTQEEVAKNLLEHEENSTESKKENDGNAKEKIEDAANFDELRVIIKQHPDIHKGFLDFEGLSNNDAIYGKDGYDYIIPKIQSKELSISRLPHDGWGVKKKIAELLKIYEETVPEKEQSEKMPSKEPMDTIATVAGEITEDLERASRKTTGRIDSVQDVITGSRIIRKINKSIASGEAMTQRDVDVMNGWFENAVDRLKKLTQPENEKEKSLDETQNEQLAVEEKETRRSTDELLKEVKKEMEKVIDTLFVPKFTRKGLFGKKAEMDVKWGESDEWQRLRGQSMRELNEKSAKVLSKAYGIEEKQIAAAKEGLYKLYEKSKIEPYAEHTVEAYINRVLKKSKIDAR